MLSRSALWVYFPLQELLVSDADSGVRVARLHTRRVSISNQLIIVLPWPARVLQYLHSQRLGRIACAICRVCLHIVPT